MRMDRVIRKVGVGCVFIILVGSLVISALSAGGAQKTGNLAIILDGLKEKSAGSEGLEESTGTQKEHGLAVSSNGAVDLQNQTKNVHVALSNASGLGRFTIGGYYNDAWQKLLYGYPAYGSTSYLTIRVDTTTTSVNYTTKSTAMDPYVVEPVHTIGEDAVSMTWRLPENITVQQTIRLVQDFARIEINATNEGNSTQEIGVRYYYDTQVAARDDAPIYIPGVGVKTTQEEYLNPTFTYWKGYDHPTVPSVVSEAKISGEDATTPTKLQIDQYGSEQAWENSVSSGSPFYDSAVLTYWAPTDVAPAQSKQVVTYYGIGAPVVKGPFNISEILVDRIAGSYCPGEQTIIKVDVVSIDQTHEGLVKIDILDGGEVLYSSPYSSTGAVPANGAATVQFNWTVGVATCGKSLDIKASLVNSSSFAVIDEMTKTSKITVDPSCPGCKAASYQFELQMTPESVTTAIGGDATFSITLVNTGPLAGQFNLTATGLPAVWFTLDENATVLTAGEEQVIELGVHVPDQCNASGTYQLTVAATHLNTGEQKNDTAELVVVANPSIEALVPASGSRLGSCDLLVAWKTLTNSTTLLYLKSEADSEYAVYTGDPGLEHAVTVYGLKRNTYYSYFVMSNSTCGSSTSDVRTFFVDNGISFRQRTYSFSVERDYNQQVMVSVENTDSEPHDLLTSLTNPYDDLYVGFVGDGSSDNLIPLNPGERKDVMLVVHAQDATKDDYPLAINITSTSATETLVDFATMQVHVHIPDVNFSITEVSTDPVTLIKRYRVQNYGDTLTDFTVYADDSIKNNVMFQPSMNHYNLYRGAVVEFDVIPIFSPESPPALGSCPNCLAGLGAGDLTGTLNAKGAGVSKSAVANFDCPDGERVYCVTLHNVGILRKMSDWYCTNRPDIDLKFDFPSGFGSANVKEATLRMNFAPFEGQTIEKHDVGVYVNGNKVGSLSNTIPKGVSEFEIDPSYLRYSSAGKADNKIGLKTEHMNGGHYQVASDAVINTCVDDLEVCVCAPSEEEAINRAIKMSYLEPSLSSITVSITEPAENQEVQKSKTVTINAQVTGDGSSADDLAVTASFSNGDSNVMLSSAGGGNYTGQWTVTNSGAPTTGECTITLRAATCEASGDATRKVKISAPDALKVEILSPKDNFIEQKDGEVVIKAQVNYYTTSIDTVGGIVKNDDLDSIKAEVDGKIITLTDTGKGAGMEDDGIYAGIWAPAETGDYTIKITAKAKKSEINDGVKEVKGIVIARPILKIKPPAGCKYKDFDSTGKELIAPVFQRKLEEPDFEVTNLTEVPSRTELIIEIEEPQGRNSYKLINNVTVSKKPSGSKLGAKWDWSSNGQSRTADVIPIGLYRVRAKLINSTDKSTLITSEPEKFYVIFDWKGQGKEAFVTNENGYQFYAFPPIPIWGCAEREYKLHQYHPKIWKKALDDSSTKLYIQFFGIDLTDRESVAKSLSGTYVRSDVKYPSELDDYWPGKNNLWYDNLKALENGGSCADQAAYLAGVLRAIGIPARMVSVKGTKGVPASVDFGKKELPHSFTEAWYDGNWHFFDQTNLGEKSPYTGKIGSTFYTEHGVQFRPDGVGLHNKKYWVTTSSTAPDENPTNIYKWYNYNLDIEDLRFDKTSYKPGDTMNVEIDVKNTGYLTIPNPRLEVWRVRESSYVAPSGEWITTAFMYPLADIDVAATLLPNQKITKTVSGAAPSYGVTVGTHRIVAKTYTLWNADKAYAFTCTKEIPGYCITPLYSIIVDGNEKTFQRFNSSFFESNVTDEKAYIKDSYEWDGLPVALDLYSEINSDRNYSKTIVTVENPDSGPHDYNFSMPVYGFGNAAYVPSFGTITSNTTVNVEASCIISYNQSSVEDTNVSVYELSKSAEIKTVEIFEHNGFKLIKANACWKMTLPPGSSCEFSVYSSTRLTNITAPSDDDTCANATPLTLGLVSSGAIDPVGDVDWCKVDVPTTDCPQILNVTLDGPEDQDLDLYVHDTCDSDYICAPLLYGSHETCFINATPGTYYIKIEGYDSSTGDYTIYTTITPNNDYCCGAVLIPGGYYGYGWIDPAGDSDWWKVETFGGELEVNLYGPAGEDFDLYIYDSCDSTVPVCTSLGLTANETCVLDVDVGTYYIQIVGYGDSTGYYEVWWSETLFLAPANQRPGGFAVSEHDIASKKLTKLKPAAHRVADVEFNFSEIHATFASEIVTHNDSLLNLGVSAPESVRVGGTIPINVTVGNGGVVEETMNLTLNVSKTALYSYTPAIIYTNTTTVSVSPNSAKNVTYSVYIPTTTEIGVWEISVDTDKGIGAKAAFTVEDAFDLTCTQNLTVLQDSIFDFNATVTNTWDTAVHDVNVSVELYYSFSASEPVEKQLGTLLPNETRTVSWQLTATSSGELPIEVVVTSDDDGCDTERTSVTALSPPILWIPTIINRISAPDPGTNKTIFLNLTVQNWGDLPAHNVQVQLLLPAHATSTAVTHALGNLSASEQKNISVDLTYSTQKDFAFEVFANDDANHTATSTIMISQYSLYEDIVDTGPGGYPSIAGVHQGVIRPSHEINVSALYTYPCAGTGGHTEYVWIHGAGVNASASWNGYQSEYQHLKFTEPFTLQEGFTYYYKIQTGSYPQIIHKQTHTTLDDSFINCTTFMDVNGRVYTDLIPAIRLY